MHKYFKILVFFVLLILAIFLVFQSQNVLKKDNKPKITVVTTIFPVYDLTEKIANKRVEVVKLIPAGASPHTYDPKPSDASSIEESALILKIGLGLDDWVVNYVEDEAKIVDLSKSVELLEFAEEDTHEHEDEDVHSHEHGEKDPHYWLSVTNAEEMSRTILQKLIEIDPEGKKYYENNYSKLKNDFTNLKLLLKDSFIGYQQRNIVTFHDAFRYFAQENNINVLYSIEPQPSTQPSPQYVKNLIDNLEKFNLRVVYKEPQLSDEVLKHFEFSEDVLISDLDPIGGSEHIDSYIKMIEYNSSQIIKGFEHEDTTNTN